MANKIGFSKILENIFSKITEYENNIQHHRDTIEISNAKNKKLERESIKNYQEVIDSANNLINNMERCIGILNNERVAVMRLIVIERYILSNIWQYPLDYQYPKDERLYVPTNMTFSVKNKDSEFFISLAVPTSSFYNNDGKIEWHYYAELMIRSNNTYYNRKDFGLSADEYDSDEKDSVFRIYGLNELQKIFQKFDTWYGTTLD